jgi:hypothetical protein
MTVQPHESPVAAGHPAVGELAPHDAPGYSLRMPSLIKAAHAREHLEELLAQIARLRGGGPNPFDYYQWDARAQELLVAIYGEGSAEVQGYYEAAGVRGRLPGVRGQAENMTLNIHGDWGIRARLTRAETLLKSLVAGLPADAS